MKRLFGFLFVVSVIFGSSTTVLANVNDFVINDFHGRYELYNDTRGGRVRVTENIKLNFPYQNHGILRAIPRTYKSHDLKLNILSVKRDGQKERFTISDKNQNAVLRIGDPLNTITGPHEYEITYEMQNVISFYQNHDELYWDINGDQWGQTFKNISAELIFPQGWESDNFPQAKCFTGGFGSKSSDCEITENPRGYSFSTTRALNAYETLTVVAATPKGLFQPYTWKDYADIWKDNLLNDFSQIFGLLGGLIASAVVVGIWYRYGKDYKGRGIIIPEYGPHKCL